MEVLLTLGMYVGRLARRSAVGGRERCRSDCKYARCQRTVRQHPFFSLSLNVGFGLEAEVLHPIFLNGADA